MVHSGPCLLGRPQTVGWLWRPVYRAVPILGGGRGPEETRRRLRSNGLEVLDHWIATNLSEGRPRTEKVAASHTCVCEHGLKAPCLMCAWLYSGSL